MVCWSQAQSPLPVVMPPWVPGTPVPAFEPLPLEPVVPEVVVPVVASPTNLTNLSDLLAQVYNRESFSICFERGTSRMYQHLHEGRS